MNKRIQISLMILCFSFIVSSYAQVKRDTVSIQMSSIENYFTGYRAQEGIYTFGGDTVTEEEFNKKVAEHDSIIKYVDENIIQHYCRFYLDSMLFQEGTWWVEFWTGPYKEYYLNGKLTMEGMYAAKQKHMYGAKIGTWKYYTEEGKLSKIELYDDKGRIQKIEEYDKNGKLKIK